NTRWLCFNNILPASVKAVFLPTRSNKGIPISNSKFLICWLSDGCDICNFSAARVKCNSLQTAMKHSSCLRSISQVLSSDFVYLLLWRKSGDRTIDFPFDHSQKISPILNAKVIVYSFLMYYILLITCMFYYCYFYILFFILYIKIVKSNGKLDKAWMAWVMIDNFFLLTLLVENDVHEQIRGKLTLIYGISLAASVLLSWLFSPISFLPLIVALYAFYFLARKYSTNEVVHIVIAAITFSATMPIQLFMFRNREQVT